nr:alkaline phosphatase d [Quercus suber]
MYSTVHTVGRARDVKKNRPAASPHSHVVVHRHDRASSPTRRRRAAHVSGQAPRCSASWPDLACRRQHRTRPQRQLADRRAREQLASRMQMPNHSSLIGHALETRMAGHPCASKRDDMDVCQEHSELPPSPSELGLPGRCCQALLRSFPVQVKKLVRRLSCPSACPPVFVVPCPLSSQPCCQLLSTMKFTVASALALSAVAEASFHQNLNYRSPSHNHPGMGLSMHKINRRHGTLNPRSQQFSASQLNFTHGVASGDPYSDSVILWTRVAPMVTQVASNASVSGYVPLYNHGVNITVSTAPVCVEFKVARTSDFAHVESCGKAYTSSDIDYTVKVEASNLTAFTRYYYQFNICGSDKKSPLGRTKTTPDANDYTAKVGLAVYSCSNFPFGFFNAFGNPARKDSVDYVLHLGDYIYEYAGDGDYGYGASIGRIPKPESIIYTLDDYRTRLATYRTDEDLLLSHQTYPWIPVWDDHEVSDNTYRDGASELNNTEASFVMDGGVSTDQRKMNAVRAYFEWMPIRQVEMDDNLRIWRSFKIGSLFDLVMLDTRQYDRSITGKNPRASVFYNQLSESADRGARWRVIGSQTVFSRVNESVSYGNVDPLDYDAWDGYQANRNRTLNHLTQNKIGNNIVISGDSHASWVSDLVWLGHANYSSQSGSGSLGVEFAGSAVSSPCPYGQNITIASANNFSDLLEAANSELHWNDLYYRGYFELHIGYDEVNASYFGLPTIVTRNPYEISLANFTVKSGENRLQRPIAGGIAESGSLKGGHITQTNLTNNTETGVWFVSHYNEEDI